MADDAERAAPGERPRSRVAVNTLIFSIATGLSRIAGLVREIVAAVLYGVSGPISAFTFAFQIPNLIRALVADAALSAAFVPVFSELLEQKKRQEAFRLAGALFGLILVALSVITVAFILLAPTVIPLLTPGDQFDAQLDALTVGLSQLMFPILVLLGLNGLVVGILNAYEHFSVPAIAPLVWNVVIIVCMVALQPLFAGDDEVYAYAIGVLAGTAVQFSMAVPVLRRVGFPLKISLARDPRIPKVLKLMLPVTIGLGLINFNLFINSAIGILISKDAPRAIDAAFRVYMLPQGIFSVAVATVLFPAMSRLAARRDLAGLRATTGIGLRQIFLLLMPAAAAIIALSAPIIRLLFEYGAWDSGDTDLTAEALLVFAFSLPFSGANLLLTRAFFSLQSPWTPTALAGMTLAINAATSLALYKPLGIAGIVAGTAVSTAAMTVGQAYFLSRRLDGLEERRTVRTVGLIALASAVLGGVAYGVHRVLDGVLGDSLPGQAIAVSVALGLGSAAYAGLVLGLKVPEARQVRALIRSRMRRR